MRIVISGLTLVAALLCASASDAESLREAVRAAVTTNPAVKAKSAEARASAYDLLQLKGDFQPELTARGKAGSEWVDDPSLSAYDNRRTKFTNELGFDANLVIFDGQRRAHQVYAGAARVDGDIFRLLDASETMALNATEVYIDVIRHLRLLDLAERTLVRHREIGRIVSNLVQAGRRPLSDQLQVMDRIRAVELAVIDIRRAGLDAEARFERIIGHRRKGAVTMPGYRTPIRSREQLSNSAVAGNYRIQFAAKEIDRAGYDINVVNADRQPEFSLNAGVRGGNNIDGVSGAESDAFVGLRLNWTLYNGGRDAERSAMIERRSKAIAEHRVAIRDIRELSDRTWNSYIANTERVVLLSVQRQLNVDLVEQFTSEFEAGSRSLLEVLEAERALFDVDSEKISAESSLAFNNYRILAVQSRLARHFGIAATEFALDPTFEDKALVKPTSVFKIDIPPLE